MKNRFWRSPVTRRIAALVSPGIFQVLVAFLAETTKTSTNGQNRFLGTILVLLISVLIGAAIVVRTGFNRFWKVHLFACFAATLPLLIMTIAILVFQGTGGYFWLGIIYMGILFVLAFVTSLPFTGFLYYCSDYGRVS